METIPEEIEPYVGPRPFTRTEGDLFFGREREIHQIVNLIYANSIVVFYSKSGLGKSSLLNAGILPRLESKDIELLGPVRIAGQIPEHLISKDLGNIFVINSIASWERERVDLQQLSHKTLSSYLEERKHKPNSIGYPSARVIIFDQFEELFFVYPDFWENKKGFFKQIQEALDKDYLLRVVFSLRQDYLGELERYLPLLRGKLQARFCLEGMKKEDALAAVKYPVRARGMTFGVGVAEKLVEELFSEEFVEPVQLQLVCRNLWQNLPPNLKVIREQELSAIGNIEQELSKLYDRCISETSVATGVKQEDLREWFEKNLITPDRTRGMVYRGSEETSGISNNAIDMLENLRIIRAEFRTGLRWYELTHDRFIDPILKSNQNWLTQSQRYR